MTEDEENGIVDTWNLTEKCLLIKSLGLKVGWKRDILPETNRPGFRGVLRQGRKIVWQTERVSVWSSPSSSVDEALNELDRRAFDAWKLEKGIR